MLNHNLSPYPFPPRPFTCSHCHTSFESAKDLRQHSAQHKWGPHKIIETEEGPIFQCLYENCDKIVRDRKILRKHLLTHQERKFACPYEGCDKRFYERAKLKRHFLVHTGEKHFQCPYEGCRKMFAYKANLKTHIRTHTGQKPFACSWPGCDKRFAQASNRNSHVETHMRHKRKYSHSSLADTKLDLHAFTPLKRPNNMKLEEGTNVTLPELQPFQGTKQVDTISTLLLLKAARGNNENAQIPLPDTRYTSLPSW